VFRQEECEEVMAQAGNLRRQARTNLQEGRINNPLGTYAQGLLEIPQTAMQYVSSSTPSSLLADAQDFAIENVAGMYDQAVNEPVDFALDMLPITGEIRAFNEAQELRRQSEQALQNGNTEEASALAQLATVTMSGAIPLLGMFRRMTRMGVRPEYEVKDDGVYLRVRAKGEGSDTASGADGDQSRGSDDGGPTPFTETELREVFENPELNFAYQLADREAVKRTGQPYDQTLTKNMPESNIIKQSAIGQTFLIATQGDPRYGQFVFEEYKRKFPEIVEETGAKNYDEFVAASYGQLGQEVVEQFDELSRAGLQTTFHRGDLDYADSDAMRMDLFGNMNLNVFRGGDRHDFLNEVDQLTGLNTNEMFRAVHDVVGHGTEPNKFGAIGEEKAFGVHSQTLSPLARFALASETRGQNSVVNYTPLNANVTLKVDQLKDEARFASPERKAEIQAEIEDIYANEFQYAPQNAVLLPPQYTDPMYRNTYGQSGLLDEIRPLVTPKEGTTFSTPAVHLSAKGSIGKEVGQTYQTDPRAYGSGHKGAERSRIEPSSDTEPRTFFYLGDNESVTGERVGNIGQRKYRYGANLTGMYSLDDDPMSFIPLVRSTKNLPSYVNRTNLLEQLIKDYGYTGYEGMPLEGQRAGLVFYPQPVSLLEVRD